MFIQSRFRFLPALLTIFVMLCSTASISATGDYRHYLPGGSVMVETIQQGTGAGAGAGSGSDTGSGSSTTGTKVLYYGYQDHLGSLTALVRDCINGNGSISRIVADYRSYDAWGRLRDPNNSLFQHEYGHYLQSQEMGPDYLSLDTREIGKARNYFQAFPICAGRINNTC